MSGESMTISGAVNKTGILLICAVLTAAWSWNRFTVAPETAALPLMIGAIGGFIVALVTIFKKEWAPMTAPLYALLEGLVLGSVSAMYEARFHGIAIQAVGLTFGTLVVAAARLSRRRNSRHRKIQAGSDRGHRRHCDLLSGGVCAGVFRGSLCRNQRIGRPSESASALCVVIVAALNLVLDFDFIENGARPERPNTWSGTRPSA